MEYSERYFKHKKIIEDAQFKVDDKISIALRDTRRNPEYSVVFGKNLLGQVERSYSRYMGKKHFGNLIKLSDEDKHYLSLLMALYNENRVIEAGKKLGIKVPEVNNYETLLKLAASGTISEIPKEISDSIKNDVAKDFLYAISNPLEDVEHEQLQ